MELFPDVVAAVADAGGADGEHPTAAKSLSALGQLGKTLTPAQAPKGLA